MNTIGVRIAPAKTALLIPLSGKSQTSFISGLKGNNHEFEGRPL